MRLLNGVILLVVFVTCQGQEDLLQSTCSVSGSWANIQNGAQAVIGGLLCNRPSYDLQSYEAVRWAFELLNKEGQILNGEYLNNSYVPGVKLGMRVKDVCSENEPAIAGATELFPQLSSTANACSQSTNLMLGVIGTSDSGTSIAVANYLKKFSIPIISYDATAPSLSDSKTYPIFMRTVPPDGPLMNVIIEVLNKLNWKYLIIVYEDSAFGRGSYNAILPKLSTAGICLTTAIRHSSSDTMVSTLEQALVTGTTGALFFGSQPLASQLLEQAEIQPDAGRLQWIFTDALSFSKDYSTKLYQRGVISVVPTSRFIVEFEDHWVRIDENNPSPENPWFKQWYMEQNNCRLNGFTEPATRPVCQIRAEREKREAFNQNPFVEPAVHAVFTYAHALRQAHRDRCGVNFTGMCPQLRSMDQPTFFNQYLKKVNFTYSKEERVPSLASDQYAPYFAAKHVMYDANGDIINPSYDVWNYNDVAIGGQTGETFRRVGTFVNGRLNMNMENMRMYSEDRKTALTAIPPSLCLQTPCGPCLGVPPETKYYFQNGDVIITGIFSLHHKGISPLTCGEYDDNSMQSGVQYLQGMIYALHKVIQLPILNGVRLGGLAFDDCNSETMATTIITQIHQGTLRIQDVDGNILDPRKIDGYTASHTSALTFPIAELMNIFKRPLVAYASPDDDLLDYPYYLRALYGSRSEKRAIVKLLKRLGYNYVQLISEDMPFSMIGIDDLRQVAAEEHVCIVSTIMMNDNGNETVQMLRKHRNVKPVILNLSYYGLRRVLKGIKDQNAVGEFALFGLHTFGNYEAVVNGNEEAADGVISLGLDHSTLNEYQNYLEGRRVELYKLENPWFDEWYESAHQCFLGTTNPKGFSTPCSNIESTPITNGTNYTFMKYLESSIHAVYVFAYGLNSTLNHYCGHGFLGVCDNFRNAKDKGEVLVEKIKEVSFRPENSPYIVRFNGKEIDQPFVFYNYVNGKFRKIGDYKVMNDRIIMVKTPVLNNGSSVSDYTPTCSAKCVECFYMFRDQDYMYIDGDVIIPGIFDVHYAQPELSPFSCGDLRASNGFQYVEAFAFTLNYINNDNTGVRLNNNLRMGGLAFDGCSNSLRASTIVNAFQTSAILFKDKNGKNIDYRKTLAWLGYDSQSTIDMADILGSLGIPVVSPGATSQILNDKDRFNTFFRTIPSESVIVRGMADLSKALGFDYVITVNAPDVASRGARDQYREYLKDLGICVLASYEFSTDGSMDIIVKSMNESSTRVIAVFAEPDMYVLDMLRTSKRYSSDFVFISNRKFRLEADRLNYGPAVQNSISFDLDMPTVQEFTDYLAARRPDLGNSNPWFGEYYEKMFNCQLHDILSSPTFCGDRSRSIVDSTFQQDLYVLSTINSVYALTKATHLTLEEKCGLGYLSICDRYLSDGDTNIRVMANMDTLNLNVTNITKQFFKFIQREGNQAFTVNSYLIDGKQRKVASFRNSILNYEDEPALRSAYRNVRTTCTDNCQVCVDSSNNFGDITHIRGDIYLIGLFDVHKKGATPYTCGELNDRHGIQLLEAFNYAIRFVNKKTGIFQGTLEGVNLGGIGLDVCQNPTRAANLVTNIHSKTITLIDPKDKSPIDTSKFDVYIGPFDTDSTIRVADVLDALSIPQITYGATSLELQDKKKYRYFLRTVPADDKQARAIISYLKKFDNNFVQIISTFDSVGQKGKEEFMRLAPLNKICVEKEIVVGYNGFVTVSEAADALKELYTNYTSRVIILFVDDPQVILQVADSESEIRDNFFFIGTDKWGMDTDILVGLDRLLRDERAVTFDVETADVPDFDHDLQYKTPENYDDNPWFKEYYEQEFECNMDATSTRYTKQCTADMMGISRNPKYVQDPYVLYVINAVFSAALGLHKSLQDLCPNRNDPSKYYNGVCQLFRNSGERRQRIYRGITQVEFTDYTYQPFYYLENGQSDRGYHIYKPKVFGNTRFYENVGSYNDTHYLKIDITYDMEFPSRCVEGVTCPCVFPQYQLSRYMLKESPFDLNLVYVANIHKALLDSPYTCGELASMSNIQSVLAFFFAIEQVNSVTNNRFPASLKLGGLAIDVCSQPMRIGEDVYSLLSGEGICHTGGRGQVISPSSIVSFHALSTEMSIPLSRILTPYKILSLSPAATSVHLSDKRLHPYFLRTVPPDDIQVRVMLQVMKQFNWNYGSIVYTNSAYGVSARDALVMMAANTDNKTCFGSAYAISSTTTLSQAEQIVVSLSQKVGSRVVILFTTSAHTRLLLQAAKSKGLTGRFVWLGSDNWANNMEIIDGYEEEAVGAITIQIRSEFIQSFNNYMIKLNFTNRAGIPDDWFEELYQTLHKCRLLESKVIKQFPRVCSLEETITDDMIHQDPLVLHTIIAVYQIAEGLNNIGVCREFGLDIYACLSLQANRRDLIYNNVLRTQFNVMPQELGDKSFTFKLHADGYGDIGYNILNFHRDVIQDKYVYTKIGIYQESLKMDRLLYHGVGILSAGIIPISICPPAVNCSCYGAAAFIGPGGTTIVQESGGGVAVVAKSNMYFYVHPYAAKGYVEGTDGTYFDAKTGVLLVVNGVRGGADRFFDIWGIVVAALAAIGAFIALCMFIYLLVVYPVRSGTTILGFLLLFGIILMYLLVFAFVFHASPEVCALRRFALGFVYALVYAVLFVKLVDFWRTKDAGDDVTYSKFGRPLGLFFLVVMLVLVQVIICAEWLILVAPLSTSIYYNQFIWPVCTPVGLYDTGLVLSLIYVMLLIILCIIFGFACFSSSRNHYESRWILGIAVLSVPTWVIWCMVAVLTDYKFRDAAVAVGLLLNATYMLLCGSLRKLYLLNKYQALIDEEEREMEKEGRSVRGTGSDYGGIYDNRGQFHHGQGSVHGSVHGSRHGTIQSNRYGYSNRGQMVMLQGGQGQRLYSQGSSVQGYEGQRGQGGMVLVQGSHQEGGMHVQSRSMNMEGSGIHNQGGGMVIDEDLHPIGGSGMVVESREGGYNASQSGGHYSEVQSGGEPMVVGQSEGHYSAVHSGGGGSMVVGQSEGHHSEAHHGGGGGVSVSQAFGSRAEED